MTERRLRELLENLHSELSQNDELDSDARDLLREVMDDIHAALERSGEPDPEEHEGLQRRLTENLDEFEEDHPRLALAVRRVMDALSRL